MTSEIAAPVRTVFCATDFSPTADRALAHAEALARRHGARLFVAHVIEPWPTTTVPPIAVVDDTERILRAAATRRLETLVAPLAARGLDVATRVVAGGPGHESVELARSLGADVIVAGTHGRSGIAHLLYGSTAEYIVRRSPVPVLTIHPNDPGPQARPQTMVLPSDLSPGAERALEAAVRLFPALVAGEGAPGSVGAARIVLLHVDEVARYFEPYGEEVVPAYFDWEQRRKEVERGLEAVAERLRRSGFEVACRVTAGTPVPVICDVARDERAELIALGTHGHSAVMNFLMGRTAQRVVQHAPCPVLTVRAADRPVTPP
ncbi:MAG: universal stress protein [Deltaproteobacteria bacterium]|nr:universal stress protein [Deltaproteobacteria bacterium]